MKATYLPLSSDAALASSSSGEKTITDDKFLYFHKHLSTYLEMIIESTSTFDNYRYLSTERMVINSCIMMSIYLLSGEQRVKGDWYIYQYLSTKIRTIIIDCNEIG